MLRFAKPGLKFIRRCHMRRPALRALLTLALLGCVSARGGQVRFYEQERSVKSMKTLDVIEAGCQLLKTREAEEGPVARAMFRNYAAEIGANVVTANAAGHDIYAAKFYSCPADVMRELELLPLCLQRPDAKGCEQLKKAKP
jgi:hypothetical protein